MNLNFLQAFNAYKELLQTGAIHSTIEGGKVILEFQGTLAGDILLFICPATKILPGEQDILELIRSDPELEQQWKTALQSFRLKYSGLTLLPKSLAWIINGLICYLYFLLKSDPILRLISGDLTEILSILPILIFSSITLVFGKTIGFKVLKPVFYLIVRIIRTVRMLRNRKTGNP